MVHSCWVLVSLVGHRDGHNVIVDAPADQELVFKVCAFNADLDNCCTEDP